MTHNDVRRKEVRSMRMGGGADGGREEVEKGTDLQTESKREKVGDWKEERKKTGIWDRRKIIICISRTYARDALLSKRSQPHSK